MYPIKADKIVITSNYGNRQYYYQGKLVKDFHTGIDLIASPNNKNEEILAFEDGEVVELRKTGKQFENPVYVVLKHKCGLFTRYYHLASGSLTVNKGDKVKKGDKLGIIGATGIATGVHLHFQIDKGTLSDSIDPTPYVFEGKILQEEVITNDSKIYETLGDMYVRRGAGLNYSIKLVKDMTEDGRKNAVSKNLNSFAVYKKGTRFTALEIFNNNYGMWARTPSGYVCIVGASGKEYCRKC